ncbi:hypothetical protein GQ42DRAFT_161164 [Ramicandelaber brevisporus]|nr:hypothetical protein GQ42DRAFT_161164 [Ramicandelaber brevisporus]
MVNNITPDGVTAFEAIVDLLREAFAKHLLARYVANSRGVAYVERESFLRDPRSISSSNLTSSVRSNNSTTTTATTTRLLNNNVQRLLNDIDLTPAERRDHRQHLQLLSRITWNWVAVRFLEFAKAHPSGVTMSIALAELDAAWDRMYPGGVREAASAVDDAGLIHGGSRTFAGIAGLLSKTRAEGLSRGESMLAGGTRSSTTKSVLQDTEYHNRHRAQYDDHVVYELSIENVDVLPGTSFNKLTLRDPPERSTSSSSSSSDRRTVEMLLHQRFAPILFEKGISEWSSVNRRTRTVRMSGIRFLTATGASTYAPRYIVPTPHMVFMLHQYPQRRYASERISADAISAATIDQSFVDNVFKDSISTITREGVEQNHEYHLWVKVESISAPTLKRSSKGMKCVVITLVDVRPPPLPPTQSSILPSQVSSNGSHPSQSSIGALSSFSSPYEQLPSAATASNNYNASGQSASSVSSTQQSASLFKANLVLWDEQISLVSMIGNDSYLGIWCPGVAMDRGSADFPLTQPRYSNNEDYEGGIGSSNFSNQSQSGDIIFLDYSPRTIIFCMPPSRRLVTGEYDDDDCDGCGSTESANGGSSTSTTLMASQFPSTQQKQEHALERLVPGLFKHPRMRGVVIPDGSDYVNMSIFKHKILFSDFCFPAQFVALIGRVIAISTNSSVVLYGGEVLRRHAVRLEALSFPSSVLGSGMDIGSSNPNTAATYRDGRAPYLDITVWDEAAVQFLQRVSIGHSVFFTGIIVRNNKQHGRFSLTCHREDNPEFYNISTMPALLSSSQDISPELPLSEIRARDLWSSNAKVWIIGAAPAALTSDLAKEALYQRITVGDNQLLNDLMSSTATWQERPKNPLEFVVTCHSTCGRPVNVNRIPNPICEWCSEAIQRPHNTMHWADHPAIVYKYDIVWIIADNRAESAIYRCAVLASSDVSAALLGGVSAMQFQMMRYQQQVELVQNVVERANINAKVVLTKSAFKGIRSSVSKQSESLFYRMDGAMILSSDLNVTTEPKPLHLQQPQLEPQQSIPLQQQQQQQEQQQQEIFGKEDDSIAAAIMDLDDLDESLFDDDLLNEF